MEGAAHVEQSLRLVQGLLGGAEHAFGLSRDAGCTVGERTTEAVTGPAVTRPALGVTVAFHANSVRDAVWSCRQMCQPACLLVLSAAQPTRSDGPTTLGG